MSDRITLRCGDCLELLPTLDENSIDACVTDPPYGLEFMGKEWDKFKTYAGGNPNIKPQGSVAFRNADGTTPHERSTSGIGYRKKNKRCRRCGKLQRGNGHCKCPQPDWDTRHSESGNQFQFFCEDWAREVYRVLKPGAHLLAFGGTRTYHRMACAIEDAGFEIRDCIQWLYGSGFPKSHDVSKGIDRAAGAERKIVGSYKRGLAMHPGNEGVDSWRDNYTGEVEITAPATDAARQWQGWGTALKPANEPIVLARKPLSEGTIAANVLKWGTGAINVDGCRVETRELLDGGGTIDKSDYSTVTLPSVPVRGRTGGRWPANVIHDGSEEVVGAFPESDHARGNITPDRANCTHWGNGQHEWTLANPGDSGSAARFFYTAKADTDDRIGSKHPTIKPLDLMQYLVRLITPKDGVVLDPFAGTGTTGEAAFREGMNAILIEREEEYQNDIRRRIALCMAGPDERKRETIKAKMADKSIDHGPLFGGT